MKTKAILFGFLFVLPTVIFSQTITNYQANPSASNSSGVGQSFTATLDGVLTQVDVQPDNNLTDATLLIYSSGNGSGLFGGRGTPDYEQTGVNLSIAGYGPTDWHSVALSTPFPIIAGEQYTYIFEHATNTISLCAKDMNSYSGGSEIVAYGVARDAYDSNFQVWESAPAPAPTPLKTWPFILLFIIPIAFIIVRRVR